MKSLILGLGLISLGAFGAGNGDFELCKSIEKAAGNVMTKRQNGESYSELYAKAKQQDETVGNIVIALLDSAWEKPQYRTAKHQQRTINDFKNTWFIVCMQETKGE